MAYTRGSNANIIVGAAALFVYDAGELDETGVAPAFVDEESYKDTLTDDAGFDNVGYTMNGLELVFQPDFGEVQVDQLLDVAKLYKQGMQVNLNTAFAEATLENLLTSIAGQSSDLVTAGAEGTLTLASGDIGDVPVERGLIAVGPGSGAVGNDTERIYTAYRALSIENVTVSAKRDEATMFEVSFRLLPNDNANYGTIVDRTIAAGS